MKRSTRFGFLAALVSLAMVTLVSTSSAARDDVTPQERRAASAGKALQNEAGTITAPIKFKSRKGTFNGVFSPIRFKVADDQLVAVGDVVGRVKKRGQKARWVQKTTTVVVNEVNSSLKADLTGTDASARRSAAAAAAPGVSCDVLNLVLGPLDLNLLGLEINLETVVLDIVANPAGGLLGQLLCAVANLLSGGLGGLLGQLTDLLNQILDVLRGLSPTP